MKKKALFIGGTGTISTAIVKRLSASGEWDVYVLNRGNRSNVLPVGVNQIVADINDEKAVLDKIGDMTFDCVCEFIGFVPSQVERDYRLFNGKTKQYIYISSASAYHKPAASYVITEGTTLANPYWQYSRDKIACEEFLMKKYREEGFPVTIVRPSHTYDERNIQWEVAIYYMNQNYWLGNGIGFCSSLLEADEAGLVGAEGMWLPIMMDRGMFGVISVLMGYVITAIYLYRRKLFTIMWVLLSFLVLKTLTTVVGVEPTYYLLIIVFLIRYNEIMKINKCEKIVTNI